MSLDQIVSDELMSFVSQVTCIDCGLILNPPSAQSFALEFSGANMASPFSFYEFPNGKFSLHHF